jgi:superfamily II DNA or RNA helicase
MTEPDLRPYQVEDCNSIVDVFDDGVRRVCYQLATGGGKTVVFCALINDLAEIGERVLVLVHTDEILQQTSAKLTDFGVEHGIIAPDQPETNDLVQVASVMSLVRRLERWNQWRPRLIVADEAHHALAATWRRILAAFPDALLLGPTATPRRLDGRPMGDIYERLITGRSIAWLIEHGYLSPVRVFTPSIDPDLSRVHVRAGDYAVDELSGVMSDGIIIDGAVDEYERLCPDAPGLCFCVDIAHSKQVAAAFARRGYRAAHLDGHTPREQRRQLMADLASGEIDLLTNCGIVSEGLDIAGVVAAILLRPTKSLALYLQMVGRALRPGKPLAYVLDHAGNVHRHGLPTAARRWTLHGKQQDDAAADDLIRCGQCGAMNPRGAEQCQHCGAELHQPRPPHVEVRGPQLVEAVEAPTGDADLADMGYRALLQWAADEDGHLVATRLERIAAIRGYKQGWIWHLRGKQWEDVWRETERWRAQ